MHPTRFANLNRACSAAGSWANKCLQPGSLPRSSHKCCRPDDHTAQTLSPAHPPKGDETRRTPTKHSHISETAAELRTWSPYRRVTAMHTQLAQATATHVQHVRRHSHLREVRAAARSTAGTSYGSRHTSFTRSRHSTVRWPRLPQRMQGSSGTPMPSIAIPRGPAAPGKGMPAALGGRAIGHSFARWPGCPQLKHRIAPGPAPATPASILLVQNCKRQQPFLAPIKDSQPVHNGNSRRNGNAAHVGSAYREEQSIQL